MKNGIILLFAVLLTACTSSESYDKITGEWSCTSWTSETSAVDKCQNNVYFNFAKDRTYSSKIGAESTTGVYKIINGRLYSTPKDKLEIAVEINTLTTDSLIFTMSRSGTKEVMTLVKK